MMMQVITEGDKGDLFYIIKDGEAIVLQNTAQGQRKVNHLFKADFFGERALLCDEPRCGQPPSEHCMCFCSPRGISYASKCPCITYPCTHAPCRIATVEASTKLVCLTLKRDTFTEILGPLEQLMSREKSPQVVAQKMAKLQPRGSASRPAAEVLIKRRKKGKNGADTWEVVRAKGHLDEVQELRKGGSLAIGACMLGGRSQRRDGVGVSGKAALKGHCDHGNKRSCVGDWQFIDQYALPLLNRP